MERNLRKPESPPKLIGMISYRCAYTARTYSKVIIIIAIEHHKLARLLNLRASHC